MFNLIKKEQTEEQKREKLIKNASSHRNKSHTYVKTMITVFAIAFFVMFTSRLWLPSLDKPAIFKSHSEYEIGKHTVILIRYDYCPSQQKAEVELDIKDKEFENAKFDYIARQNDQSLKIKTMVSSPDNVIFQINGIDPEAKDIDLTIGFVRSNTDLDKLTLTYLPENITQVNDLTPKTKNEYIIQRLTSNLKEYQGQITTATKEITDKTNLITSIVERNNELLQTKDIKTSEEREEIDTQITQNLKEKERIEKEIMAKQEEIKSIQKKINEVQTNIAVLKKGETHE